MPPNVKIRSGKTRQSGPEHYFRVQVRWDGQQRFVDALVMKRDDSKGPDRTHWPYRVAWAATQELEQDAEAALGELKERFSAKHTKAKLRTFLRSVPSHLVPPDAEVPVNLAVSIARSRFPFEKRDGPPEAWEQEADAAALRRAATASRPPELPGKNRLLGLVRSRFPGWLGFADPRFDGGPYDEVKYKLATAERAKELLSEPALRGLVDVGDHGEVIERLKRIGRDTNLLFRPYSPGGDLALLYHEGLDRRRFCGALLHLLYDEGDATERIDRYAAQIKSMELPRNVNRWAMPTYFLFFLNPAEEVLVKPGTVRKLLEIGGWDGGLGVEPSGADYARVRTAYRELREGLRGYGPRHMIDVQGFAWVAMQEADERGKAVKRARDTGYELDPRVERALAEFAEEADALALIERQEILDRAKDRFKEIIGAEAKAESLSPNDFFDLFNDIDTHGGRTPGLFSPNVAFSKNPDTRAYRDLNDDLPVLRRALVALLHGQGTDAERIDRMWEIGSGVRRYITESLAIPSALLFLQTPAKWSGILHMAEKGKKLTLAGIAPAVADDASRGERLVALERTLVELPPKYGRKNWDPMTTEAFYSSRAFESQFADPRGSEPSPEPRSFASLIQSLQERGLHFQSEVVANYILALQTKRFAILTGISGTGKTQIAKAVAQYFGPARQAMVERIPEDAFGIEVSPYQFKYSRIVIPVAVTAYLDLLGPHAPLPKRKIRVHYPAGQVALTYNQNRQGATNPAISRQVQGVVSLARQEGRPDLAARAGGRNSRLR